MYYLLVLTLGNISICYSGQGNSHYNNYYRHLIISVQVYPQRLGILYYVEKNMFFLINIYFLAAGQYLVPKN